METNYDFLKSLHLNLSKEIEHKWRVQSFSKNKPSATIVAYIDSRNASDLLNEFAIYGWNDEYYDVSGNTYCRVGIVMPDGSIQWRSDCGVESNQDAEKGKASDAFKRACVKWGIGRFLYNLGIEYVKSSGLAGQGSYPHPVDNNGQRIYDLTKHINSLKDNLKKPITAPKNLPTIPAPLDERKFKALGILSALKTIDTVPLLLAAIREFKGTKEGANVVDAPTIVKFIELNTIDVINSFYKFAK